MTRDDAESKQRIQTALKQARRSSRFFTLFGIIPAALLSVYWVEHQGYSKGWSNFLDFNILWLAGPGLRFQCGLEPHEIPFAWQLNQEEGARQRALDLARGWQRGLKLTGLLILAAVLFTIYALFKDRYFGAY